MYDICTNKTISYWLLICMTCGPTEYIRNTICIDMRSKYRYMEKPDMND